MFGFYKPHNNPNCMMFLKAIFGRAKSALECSKFLLKLIYVFHKKKQLQFNFDIFFLYMGFPFINTLLSFFQENNYVVKEYMS